MPVQNLRAFRWSGESLDGGPSNLRNVLWGGTPATQNFSPNIQTLGFRLTYATELSSFLADLTSNIPTATQGEFLIKNQNICWVTFTVTGNTVTAGGASLLAQTWQVAVPPMGMFFVPSNVTAFTGCVAGVPSDAIVPTAQASNMRLNFDMLVWG